MKKKIMKIFLKTYIQNIYDIFLCNALKLNEISVDYDKSSLSR